MKLNKIRFKNFFSSGNAFIEVDLTKYNKAVISAKNGMGKSTIFSAITFALFGKTIKPVTKAQIVNSINNKNCLVEIELESGDSSYLIKRGIKPNIFEVYKDSILLDQTASLDYQDYLEDHILKCTFRTFLQTSIISVENYKPFMTLSKSERRDFIEDILDIKVFTLMNQITKNKITKNKDELKLLDVTLKSLKDKIILQKEHINTLETLQSGSITLIDTKVCQCKKNLTEADLVVSSNNITLKSLVDKIKELKVLQNARNDINSKLIDVKSKLRRLETDLAYIEEHPNCPTCNQAVDSTETKLTHIDKYNSLSLIRDSLLLSLDQYDGVDDKLQEYNEQVGDINSTISVANFTISSENKNLLSLERERSQLLNSDDISSKKDALKEFAREALKLKDRHTEINTEQDYNLLMLELFKDSGIKSKIVDQYLPIINSLVNGYLDKLDFFVSFNLDSEFNEIIKSRHRDSFTYSSFSAGERQRIDMSLMFTFRQLAKMKNSFSCNLLALDEITDSSLDSTGIELLMGILGGGEFKGSNILVISHANKERFEDVFDGCYNVTKRDGFSEISDERL